MQAMSLLPLLALVLAPNVSVDTLLPEMNDLHRLYKPPVPTYTCSQASSYDRRSKSPGNSDWFANGDAGHFVRQEQVANRVEYVLADLKGPGAVVRIWSANPAGVVRFYFDGESTPRVQERLADLLSERHAPFGYESSSGRNLYFPFPYSKSLKITVDDSEKDSNRIYYHVGYRTYTEPVNVQTYTPGDLENRAHGSEAVAFTKLNRIEAKSKPRSKTMKLYRGQSDSMSIDGAGVVEQLTLQVTPTWAMGRIGPINSRLRHLELQIDFDGEKCVRVPAADFFGCPPGLTPYQTMVTKIDATGRLTALWKMPFAKKATFRLVNHAEQDVTATLTAMVSDRRVREPFYRFHAQWTCDNSGTRPFRDMTFLDTLGSGMYVGTGLAVGNANGYWWGEGDEKVWVDGESFPSTFGTGTEDYFGYAWSSPALFEEPYHAQPRADGPANGGQVANVRWHVIDSIPFTKELKFQLEAWHWKADDSCSWAGTAFWYGTRGSTQAKAVDLSKLTPVEHIPNKPVVGAIEGEGLPVLEHVGGNLEHQGGFANLSGDYQLWWTDPNPGDHLTLQINVPKSGTYELIGNFCFARNYGIHHLYLDDVDLGEHDFFGELGWKLVSLGKHELKEGPHRLRVVAVGDNPKADPKNHMFGLDYLLLK